MLRTIHLRRDDTTTRTILHQLLVLLPLMAVQQDHGQGTVEVDPMVVVVVVVVVVVIKIVVRGRGGGEPRHQREQWCKVVGMIV